MLSLRNETLDGEGANSNVRYSRTEWEERSSRKLREGK